MYDRNGDRRFRLRNNRRCGSPNRNRAGIGYSDERIRMCLFNYITNTYGFFAVFDGSDPDDEMVVFLVDVYILKALQSVFDGFGFRRAFSIHRLDKESPLTGLGRPYTCKLRLVTRVFRWRIGRFRWGSMYDRNGDRRFRLRNNRRCGSPNRNRAGIGYSDERIRMCLFNYITNTYGFFAVFDGSDPDDEMVVFLVDVYILKALQSVFDGFGFRRAFSIHRLDKESPLTGLGRPYTCK